MFRVYSESEHSVNKQLVESFESYVDAINYAAECNSECDGLYYYAA